MKNIFAMSMALISLLSISSGQTSHGKTQVSAVPRYDLNIRVSPRDRRLEVSGTLRLPAADLPRSEIRLSLSELMRDLTVELIEPAASAGIAKVERASTNGKNLTWIIRPVRPIPAHHFMLLRFSYAGGEQLANQFYIGPEVSFASAWGTDWYPLIDNLNDKGIGSLRFTVPAGQEVYATGDGRSSNQEEAKGLFKFEVVHPTYFAFAAGNYTIVRRSSSVSVAAYLLKQRQHTEQYLDGVSRILEVLRQEFGNYPFDEFALVEIPRDLALKANFNAVATQGGVLLNSNAFNPDDVKYVLNFLGHEFSHQWFPHTVALKTPPGLYMEEALSEYGGLRVVETLAGDAAAEQYRRTGFKYDPYFSALEYFKLVGAGFDNKLSDLQRKPKHRELAYNKGFLVWDMLSREIGRERFQRILHNLTRRYAFREIRWNELLKAIQEGAGRDLRWFYAQWFDRTGAPDFELSWKQQDGKLRGNISQPFPYYQATLEIEATNHQGQRLVRTVRVHGARSSFAFPVTFHVEGVMLDPRYLVLRWTSEYRKAADATRSSMRSSLSRAPLE